MEIAPLAAVQQASAGDQVGTLMLRKALDNQAGFTAQLLQALPNAQPEGKGSLVDASL